MKSLNRRILGSAIVLTLGIGGTLASSTPAAAAPNCLVLSRAIVRMLAAAEASRQAGFLDVYAYRMDAVYYYESMYEGQGCP